MSSKRQRREREAGLIFSSTHTDNPWLKRCFTTLLVAALFALAYTQLHVEVPTLKIPSAPQATLTLIPSSPAFRSWSTASQEAGPSPYRLEINQLPQVQAALTTPAQPIQPVTLQPLPNSIPNATFPPALVHLPDLPPAQYPSQTNPTQHQLRPSLLFLSPTLPNANPAELPPFPDELLPEASKHEWLCLLHTDSRGFVAQASAAVNSDLQSAETSQAIERWLLTIPFFSHPNSTISLQLQWKNTPISHDAPHP